MFCLRTWIPVLFFLTNVSPIYLILFVSATWYLSRPCLYCSLLLTVLVISLYDWRSDWFEPRNNLWVSLIGNTTSKTMQHGALESASAAASLFNTTAGALVNAASESMGRRVTLDRQDYISGAQWLRELIGRKELRIPCLEVVVRL